MPRKKIVDPNDLVTLSGKDVAWVQYLKRKSHWYALYCDPRHERKNVEALGKAGFDSYVPIRRELHQWSDRKRWVDVVLTPRFIFVKMKLSDKSKIFVDKSIKSLVSVPGTRGRACPIGEEQMEAFIELTQRTSNIELIQTPLEKGDMVRVMSGPLEGYIGEFVRIERKSMILVRLNDAISGAVKMSRRMVERIPDMQVGDKKKVVRRSPVKRTL